MNNSTAFYLALIRAFADSGYGLYRTNIALMDVVGETYGLVIKDVFRRLKLALDLNGIISPGKSGIAV